jgi:hypothetical protein
MRSGHHLAFFIIATAVAGCSAVPPFDDPFEPYAQRSNTVTLSAGNAKEANATIHVIDPWPPYVGDTRIPGDGQRMADAVNRYKDVSKLPKAPRPISPTFGDIIGIAAGSGGNAGQ